MFLIKGKPRGVQYYIMHYTGKSKFDHDKLEEAKVKFALRKQVVKIVGFYSDCHQGIFTCMGNLHMHVITQDGHRSGRVKHD